MMPAHERWYNASGTRSNFPEALRLGPGSIPITPPLETETRRIEAQGPLANNPGENRAVGVARVVDDGAVLGLDD
jgi:hypothetical protein